MNVTQTEFTTALLNADAPIPAGMVDSQGRPAGKRFDVYRNNVIVSLIDALETAFPAIHKLVGDAFFKAMAGVYVRAYPPTTPMMMFYGNAFPTFLEGFEPVQNIPYLADVARLELERRHSYHAADSTAVSPDDLAAIAPEDLMDARLKLAATMRLCTSPYPVLSIWNMNMVKGAPQPEPVAQSVLLTRPELDVDMIEIDTATHCFLSNLRNSTLGGAYDAAINITDDFDLSQAIGVLLSHQLITDINTQRG